MIEVLEHARIDIPHPETVSSRKVRLSPVSKGRVSVVIRETTLTGNIEQVGTVVSLTDLEEAIEILRAGEL